MKKSSKDIERIIRNSIDVDSRDFFDELPKIELSESITRNNRLGFYLSLSFSTVFIVVVSFFIFNNVYSPKESIFIDELKINNLGYDNGLKDVEAIYDYIDTSEIKEKKIEFICSQFNINKISLVNYTMQAFCNYNIETNHLNYCKIVYFDGDIPVANILLSKEKYQLFNEENEDKWVINSKDKLKSKISGKEIVVIKDLNNNLNYKTKFKYKDTYITIETFDVDENIIFDAIKQIVK